MMYFERNECPEVRRQEKQRDMAQYYVDDTYITYRLCYLHREWMATEVTKIYDLQFVDM